MKNYMEEIICLMKECDQDERELIESLVFSAANYVQAVVKMETAAANVAGRDGEDLRNTVSRLDDERRKKHNSLISDTDIVNRICENHGLPKLYEGDELRRHYGDFAMELAKEIFDARK